jgi:hypothetical protein
VFKHGDLITYRENLLRDIGESAVERMEAKRYDTVKLTADWYHAMIKHYQSLLKDFQ